MSARKTPHTGPGHAAGDPGWCEGCAAELETPTGTNESELREQVARAIHAATERPESICRTGETDWDLLDSDAAEEYRAEAAAVIPIVEAEVRAAKAEAWDEAHEVGWNNADEYWRCDGLIPSYSKADTYPNPYHETGDQR